MTQALTVYRRSQIEDNDCLYRWNKVWNEGVDDSGDASIRGQAFAHIKHLYILKLVEHGVSQDAEEAMNAFVQGIAEHQTPTRLIGEIRELWMRHAEFFSLDLDRYLMSEERQEADGLSWAPDLVYAHPTELEVVDDKSWFTMLTENEARQSFQARVYIAAARKRWPGFHSYRFTFNFVRFNKVTSVVFTQAELDAVELEVAAARARLEEAQRTGSWPAVAGTSCRYCELRCPLVDTTVDVRMPVRLSHDDAPKAAAAILVGEKFLKGMKKLLKGYCATNGAVQIGEVAFDNRAVPTRAYPLSEVVAVLTKVGQMGALEQEGLTISHSALSKLFKAYPDLEKMLAPSCQSKTTFRFGAKRPGEDDNEGE